MLGLYPSHPSLVHQQPTPTLMGCEFHVHVEDTQ